MKIGRIAALALMCVAVAAAPSAAALYELSFTGTFDGARAHGDPTFIPGGQQMHAGDPFAGVFVFDSVGNDLIPNSTQSLLEGFGVVQRFVLKTPAVDVWHAPLYSFLMVLGYLNVDIVSVGVAGPTTVQIYLIDHDHTLLPDETFPHWMTLGDFEEAYFAIWSGELAGRAGDLDTLSIERVPAVAEPTGLRLVGAAAGALLALHRRRRAA